MPGLLSLGVGSTLAVDFAGPLVIIAILQVMLAPIQAFMAHVSHLQSHLEVSYLPIANEDLLNTDR